MSKLLLIRAGLAGREISRIRKKIKKGQAWAYLQLALSLSKIQARVSKVGKGLDTPLPNSTPAANTPTRTPMVKIGDPLQSLIQGLKTRDGYYNTFFLLLLRAI